MAFLSFLDLHHYRGFRFEPPSLRCLVHLLNMEQKSDFPDTTTTFKYYSIGVDLRIYPQQGGQGGITIECSWTEEEMAVALKMAAAAAEEEEMAAADGK